MGHKIFVSYKYSDNNVLNILGPGYFGICTARNYVDKIEEALKDPDSDNIYKGESDGEDLSQLAESTIWEKLKARIYDSTVTVVLISKGMKDLYKGEKNQWIPQEISYSLRETPRKNKSGISVVSHTNALLAVVLPDRGGDYSYFMSNRHCCDNGCILYQTDSPLIFNIMRGNLFNQKNPDCRTCDNSRKIYHGEYHYMVCVRWEDFSKDMNSYIERALEVQSRKDEYDIQKEV